MLGPAVALGTVLCVGACQPVQSRGQLAVGGAPPASEGQAAPAEELPELAPPNVHVPLLDVSSGPTLEHDIFFGWSCEEIATWAGVSLPTLSQEDSGGRTPVCAVEGSYDDRPPEAAGGRDAAGIPVTAALHVFYLPPGADPSAKTYLELFADGMIDLIITLTPRTENPAPSEADPSQMAGGYAPFDVRGERGVVQRSPPDASSQPGGKARSGVVFSTRSSAPSNRRTRSPSPGPSSGAPQDPPTLTGSEDWRRMNALRRSDANRPGDPPGRAITRRSTGLDWLPSRSRGGGLGLACRLAPVCRVGERDRALGAVGGRDPGVEGPASGPSPRAGARVGSCGPCMGSRAAAASVDRDLELARREPCLGFRERDAGSHIRSALPADVAGGETRA